MFTLPPRYSFDSLSKLLEFLERFSNFSGLIERIAQFDEVRPSPKPPSARMTCANSVSCVGLDRS
jgi:hypothetical protein